MQQASGGSCETELHGQRDSDAGGHVSNDTVVSISLNCIPWEAYLLDLLLFFEGLQVLAITHSQCVCTANGCGHSYSRSVARCVEGS